MPIITPGTKQKGSISGIDAGGESFSTAVWLPVLTAGNIVAKSALWATVLSTWNALFLGEAETVRYADTEKFLVARPTNGAAREVALKLIARSTATGQTLNQYWPTINIALISYIPNYGAKDVVDLTTDELAAFIAALNAMPLINPYDPAYADTMTIVGAQVVKGSK